MPSSSSSASINPTAFDAFAADYDADFSRSRLGQLLRPRVWRYLGVHFQAGQHVLELTCGTGEDALWLARRGVHVTATDGAAEMIRVTQEKVAAAGLAEQVSAQPLSLQALLSGQLVGQFDGVYSNFGGLNTIDDWRSLAKALADCLKPGGKAVLVPMGPVCPWEILWHLGHGQIRPAFRRLGRSTTAKIGKAVIPIWYPSIRRLRADFAPWFHHRQTESLELWLPPSYLGHLVERWPGFFERLSRFEQKTARLTGGWGDHYIALFERR
jgi:SAM-dependent methyltransferase